MYCHLTFSICGFELEVYLATDKISRMILFMISNSRCQLPSWFKGTTLPRPARWMRKVRLTDSMWECYVGSLTYQFSISLGFVAIMVALVDPISMSNRSWVSIQALLRQTKPRQFASVACAFTALRPPLQISNSTPCPASHVLSAHAAKGTFMNLRQV